MYFVMAANAYIFGGCGVGLFLLFTGLMTRKVLVAREIQKREEKVKMIDSWTFEDEEIFDSEDDGW